MANTFIPRDRSLPVDLKFGSPEYDAAVDARMDRSFDGPTTVLVPGSDQAPIANVGAAPNGTQHPDLLHLPHNLYAPTIADGIMHFLYQWGPNVQFVVQPLNMHEADHETGTDWAQKEVTGAAIYREWVGENDESLYIRGRVFPYRIGGFDQLQQFEAERRVGSTHPLLRGDGYRLGWFVCEKLVRAHTYLSGEGVGQQVAFEAVMVRVPMPEPAGYVTDVWRGSP